MSQQFWIGTVSKEHVLNGKKLGIAQVCHGKGAPLKRMHPRDVLVYYSPNITFGEKSPLQCFTAIGIIQSEQPYQVTMTEDFMPYRHDVKYLTTQDIPIRPLLSQLSFIKDKTNWGVPFRFGILKIPRDDFIVIATAMGLLNEQINELFV